MKGVKEGMKGRRGRGQAGAGGGDSWMGGGSLLSTLLVHCC